MSTILIVDDMAVFREPIAAALRSKGYDTICATNGREALEVLKTGRPDLVLLDVAMPVMDGLEFLTAVRNDDRLPQRPVILLSGIAEREAVVQAARLGVREYLLKSHFSLKELEGRIRRNLAGARPVARAATTDAARPASAGGASSGSPAAPAGTGASAGPAGASADPAAPAGAGASAGPTGVPASPAAPVGAGVTAKSPAAPAGPAAPGPDGSAASGTVDTAEPTINRSNDAMEVLNNERSLVRKSEVIERLENAGELKAFSPTVAKILKLTNSDSATVDQISRAIKQDQALAVRILKLANSPVYTRGDAVESVDKAVLRIGMSQIRQVMLNIGVIDNFSTVSMGAHLDAGPFWEHCIACGIIAAEVARTRSDEEAELAFTMGLMHDVGRIMCAQVFSEEYQQVLSKAEELKLPLEQVEKRLLTLSHADCMDRLLHAWNFPRELIDPIVFHQLSLGNIRRMAPRRVNEVATLALANRLCHALCLGASGNETLYPTEEFCQALKIDVGVLQRIEECARDETEDLKFALLAQAQGDAWADLRQQYQQRLNAPFRPLYVSERPEYDAYRMFCDQLTDRDDPTPNVIVVHLAEARQQTRLSSACADAEKQAGAGRLPMIILSPSGQTELDRPLMRDRPCQLLDTPTPVARLIEAVNAVGQHQDAAAAA